MSEIKAIETIYNGYRFRSRLEARWAVFFDKCGIRYEYEMQGFEKNTGEKYLPDFYLPEYDWYVEIKPTRDNAGKEIERASHFVDGKHISVLLILGNIPKWHKIDFWFYLALFYNPVQKEVNFQWVAFEPKSVDFEYPYGAGFNAWLGIEKTHLPTSVFDLTRRHVSYFDGIHEYDLDNSGIFWSDNFADDDKEYLHEIYNAARQARFEHGERG